MGLFMLEGGFWWAVSSIKTSLQAVLGFGAWGMSTEYSHVSPFYWVAVKELELSYYIGETLFFYYIYPLW